MSRFIDKTRSDLLDPAIAAAERILNDEGFIDLVSKTRFTHIGENASNNYMSVSQQIRKRIPAEIYFYKTKWPWSAATAYTDNRGRIFINTRKLNRSLKSLVNTIVHEYMHCIGFNHGDNYYTPAKANTAPYKVGSMVEDFV